MIESDFVPVITKDDLNDEATAFLETLFFEVL
jgi:hypothetical protein